jgi:subtilase family serine protease
MHRILIGCMLIVTLLLVLAGLGAASPNNAQEPKCHTTIHIRQPLATSGPVGLVPTQIRSAYNLPSTGGSGTIAIIDAYDDQTAQSDLNVFSGQFGLPAANFEKHMMALAVAADSGWALEESLDIQWAHAIAPGAKILLVEAKSSNVADLLAAVNYARGRADVVAVSMSWGANEFSGETAYDSYFTSTYGATFFAASGDNGSGVIWPAASPNVVGVGGTTLIFSGSSLASETGWNGSGGGVSRYESAPSYQTSFGISGANGKRAVPDVSYDADPNSGVPVYDSYVYGGWLEVGGTSAGAPQWAAIQSLGFSSTNSNFYKDAKASYSSYFRDITSGSNGNTATTGYDLVTGLGSPLTVNFVPAATIPDFTLGASPASQTVVQGNSTSYSIIVNPVNGFNNSVNLSLSGLPSGVSGIFTPNPTTGTSSLSVTTSSRTPVGTYCLTVTGVNGTLTRTTNTTLIVTTLPNFSLSASPTSTTINRGGSTTFNVHITPIGNFTGKVTMSVTGLPGKTTAIFSSNPATNASILTIGTFSSSSRGTYSLTITGVSGTITKSTNVTLIIR